MKNNILLLITLLILNCPSYSQISISNLLEYQVGNLPYNSPSNLTTLYDQLNLSYFMENLTLSTKLEQFSTNDFSRSYTVVAQRSFNYQNDDLRLTVGNFYDIIGNGLLLRSYEIPGTILENEQIRKRYGFYRDIDGILLGINSDFLTFKALRGRPLNNDWPPDRDEKDLRSDLVEATEVKFNFVKNWNFSGAYLRRNFSKHVFINGGLREKDSFEEYGGFSIFGNLPFDVQFNLEYAQQFGDNNELLDISNKTAHALYSSLNFVYGPVGGSLEYKDYYNFRLRFNDPPPLIKEHQYVILNRSTHILNADDEIGWQGEVYFTLSQGHVLTLNVSEAKNTFFGTFKERFLQVYFNIDESSSIKGFLDYAQDPFKLEQDRYSGGLYYDKVWFRTWSTIIDLEYQKFDRNLEPTQKVENIVVGLTISQAPSLSFGIIWERSTDPVLTDIPTTLDNLEREDRDWIGYVLGYQYNNNHFINLFYGKRRGGPACTSGICYNVLDFEGLELRLSSIF